MDRSLNPRWASGIWLGRRWGTASHIVACEGRCAAPPGRAVVPRNPARAGLGPVGVEGRARVGGRRPAPGDPARPAGGPGAASKTPGSARAEAGEYHPVYARGARLHGQMPEVQPSAGAAPCGGHPPLGGAPRPVRGPAPGDGRSQRGTGR
eukprot:4580016-Alexandrium_andersonii.AAC.1